MSKNFSWSDLTAGYGETTVLRSVSASLEPGDVLGIVGRNGAGKTTLCRALTAGCNVFSGEVKNGDLSILGLKSHEINRAGVSYCPQENGIFSNLTVRQNLELSGSPVELADRANVVQEFPFIASRRNVAAGKLSGGERKMLAFVRTVSEASDVYIFDEPTEGVQQENIEKVAKLITSRLEGKVSIVAEQNITFLELCATKIAFVENGTFVEIIKMANLDRTKIKAQLAI